MGFFSASKIVVANVFIFTSMASWSCDRSPRKIEYFGQEIKIYVSESASPTNIMLPESNLAGGVADNPFGIDIVPDEVRSNRFSISVENHYNGMIYVDGQSGETYKLNVVYREDCADSLVEIIPQREILQPTHNVHSDPERETLMQYLWHAFDPGEITPVGYQRIGFQDVPRDRRLVFSEGKMRMYYDTVYEGPRFTGHIFEVINKGRQSYYFDYDAIDFTDPRLVKLLGIAREVSMIPADRTLDPAPEFVEDIFANQSTAFLYIVSENKTK